MATVNFTTFLPEVLPQVPACSDVLAINAVRNAAIEFCGESTYWQETQDAVTVTAADLPYDFEAPASARVSQVLSLSVDGTEVDACALDELEQVRGWRAVTSNNISRYYQPTPNQFGLYPAPSAACSVVLRVAYTPTRAATGIEEYVYQTHLETIAAGALSRLLTMPAQPWTNPELGQYYRAKFMQGITYARIEANKSYNRAVLQMASNQFV